MELNMCDFGDRWSLRQCGVYQQIYLENGTSTWILLHISTRMRETLNRALKSRIYLKSNSNFNVVLPLVIFLSAMASNWQDYLEYLQSEITSLVSPSSIQFLMSLQSITRYFQDEKACGSRLDRNLEYDYSVTFRDCQNLQSLREKLFRTPSVLDSCLAVVMGCEAHLERLVHLKITSIGEQCFAEVRSYKEQIKGHCKHISRILEHSSETNNLVLYMCRPCIQQVLANERRILVFSL
jgi:hypothetical protein